MKALALLLTLALALAALASPAAAQEPPPPTPSPDEVNAIAKNMYCPVCAGVPLDACGTAACIQWREQIADLLIAGYSEAQIYDYFVERFGPSVLATPPAQGFFWLIYLLPPIAIFGGGWWLYRNLVTRPATKPGKPRKAGKTAGKYARQLEEELKTRR